MNQDISKLEQQLAETKKQIEALEQQLNEAKKPKPWEPQGGRFTIASDGQFYSCDSSERCRQFGQERPTSAAATKALKAMRIHNRLLAYVDEFAPDYDPDWTDSKEAKCYLFLIHSVISDKSHWDYSTHDTCKVPGTVYMPRSVAEDLVKKLTSGEVVL